MGEQEGRGARRAPGGARGDAVCVCEDDGGGAGGCVWEGCVELEGEHGRYGESVVSTGRGEMPGKARGGGHGWTLLYLGGSIGMLVV